MRNCVECPILRQGGARVALVEFDPRVDELQAEVQRVVQQAAETPRDQLFSEIWALAHAYTGRPTPSLPVVANRAARAELAPGR